MEALSALEEPKKAIPPSLSGYGPIERKLDDLIDAVNRNTYVVAHADPSQAPLTLRPDIPHISVRRAKRKTKLRRLTANFD